MSVASEYYYLEPGFDAKKLTIHQLTSILSVHDVPVPNTAQRKSVYLDLFQAQITAKADKIIAQLRQVKASNDGIQYVQSDATNDENLEPVVVQKSPMKKHALNTASPSRKRLRALSEEMKLQKNDQMEEVVVVKTPKKSDKPAPSSRTPGTIKTEGMSPRISSRRASTRLEAAREAMDTSSTNVQSQMMSPPTLGRFLITPSMPGIRSRVQSPAKADVRF